MEFKKDDLVTFKNLHGKTFSGVIVQITEDYFVFGDKAYLVDVNEDPTAGGWVWGSFLTLVKCTCGAASAHYPNKPPGHSAYCEVR